MTQDPVIQLINATKSFGKQTVLNQINIEIYPGQTTVVVGKSGQGKSVLLKLMLGLLKPEGGQILVMNRDITRLKTRDLTDIRLRFGVLFQGGALFDSMTVYDNVALPLRERTKLSETEIEKKVMEHLELLGIEESRWKYPAQISGGMQKRVSLARAIQLDPEIVLFDEPTTGLDPSTSNEIYNMFYLTHERLHYTAVIVSHDIPKIFNLADQVVVLHDGRIQECASPDDIQRSQNPIVRQLLDSTMGPVYLSEEAEKRDETI
ncbi:MAG: ATP-binding cassette domain-containing protein [Deltaproteobacteria bacterium]|nr:ATP-binding cassette domain-containing protein [Deltaproteobacteria bacterium]MBW2306669.1 ATP-binding cassette domain-containing protein [Deltaproteobacteria bacterium]